MVKGFYKDLKKAKKAEKIALDVLQMACDDKYDFEDVSDEREYFHKGDIQCYDPKWNCHYYIDVKDDGVVHRSRNINAEDKVYYRKEQQMIDGFMKIAEYDYIAYVSQPEKKIYMLDFHLWQKHYKKGKYKTMQHEAQYSYCYLMNLDMAKDLGILIAEIDYDTDGKLYFPTEIKKIA